MPGLWVFAGLGKNLLAVTSWWPAPWLVLWFQGNLFPPAGPAFPVAWCEAPALSGQDGLACRTKTGPVREKSHPHCSPQLAFLYRPDTVRCQGKIYVQQGFFLPQVFTLVKKNTIDCPQSQVFLVLDSCKGAAGTVHENMLCRQGFKNTPSADRPGNVLSRAVAGRFV